MELLFNENTKQQSNLYIQVTYLYPNWLFGCSAWGTEPNSTQLLWYVSLQDRILYGLILFLWKLCRTKIK